MVAAVWMRSSFATHLPRSMVRFALGFSQNHLHDHVEIGGGWNWVGLSGEFPNCLTASISCFYQIVANLGAAAGQDVSF